VNNVAVTAINSINRVCRAAADFQQYVEVSNQTRGIFRDYDPDMQAGSLDEAYLDVTAYCAEHGMSGVFMQQIDCGVEAQHRVWHSQVSIMHDAARQDIAPHVHMLSRSAVAGPSPPLASEPTAFQRTAVGSVVAHHCVQARRWQRQSGGACGRRQGSPALSESPPIACLQRYCA